MINNVLRDMNEVDAHFQNEVKENLKDHCNYFSKWAEDNRAHVLQQSGKLGEFWESTYLVDLPTGATPQKNTYEYPKLLSATSPHEKLITRYLDRLAEDGGGDGEPTNEVF